MSKPRRNYRSVDGVLLLDKPLGISSQQAVSRARHLFNAAKAGHTGTLDPAADGLLPVCFGEATKFSHFLLDADKTYVATVRLGVTTTTGDAEGDIIASKPPVTDPMLIARAVEKFRGDIVQTPPMHSALKDHQAQESSCGRSNCDQIGSTPAGIKGTRPSFGQFSSGP